MGYVISGKVAEQCVEIFIVYKVFVVPLIFFTLK